MLDKKALFTDLDDTLYPWLEVYLKSFQQMVFTISKKTKISEEIIINSFRKVYKKRKSLEYSFSIQELDIWKTYKFTPWKIDEVLSAGREAFGVERNMHLKLFPNVRYVCKWLRKNNVLLFAITMAPGYHGKKRLSYLRLNMYFDHFYNFIDFDVPDYAPFDVKNPKKPVSKKIEETKFRFKERKPDPTPLENIIKLNGLEKRNVFYVGDSLNQDIAMAQEAKIVDIWAKYANKRLNPELSTLLKKISTFTEKEREVAKNIKNNIKPTHEITDFGEIIQIISDRGTRQSEMF